MEVPTPAILLCPPSLFIGAVQLVIYSTLLLTFKFVLRLYLTKMTDRQMLRLNFFKYLKAFLTV